MSTFKDQFGQHFAALRKTVEKNRYFSSHSHIFLSPDFQAIVALGKNEEARPEIVKLLFCDLLQESTWETLIALAMILDYQSEPGDAGNFSNLTAGLVALGKKLGYI